MITVRTYLDQSDGRGIGLYAADPIPAGAVWCGKDPTRLLVTASRSSLATDRTHT